LFRLASIFLVFISLFFISLFFIYSMKQKTVSADMEKGSPCYIQAT
jgi:hypothetical protein